MFVGGEVRHARPTSSTCTFSYPEAEFLDVIGTKVFRVSSLLFTVTSTNRFYSPPPPPPSKSGLKLVWNVSIVYGNLKSENSQDFAQKPQWNRTFMKSASGRDDIKFVCMLAGKICIQTVTRADSYWSMLLLNKAHLLFTPIPPEYLNYSTGAFLTFQTFH